MHRRQCPLPDGMDGWMHRIRRGRNGQFRLAFHRTRTPPRARCCADQQGSRLLVMQRLVVLAHCHLARDDPRGHWQWERAHRVSPCHLSVRLSGVTGCNLQPARSRYRPVQRKCRWISMTRLSTRAIMSIGAISLSPDAIQRACTMAFRALGRMHRRGLEVPP